MPGSDTQTTPRLASPYTSFEALFRAHHRRVYALCLRMSCDVALAEEYTQDSFTLAWRRLGSFEQGTNFSAWLMKIAVNVVRQGSRSQRRRVAREAQVGGQGAGRSLPGLRHDLDKALLGLPEAQRQVFVLHDIEGFTHAEIAQLLEVPEGTSRSRLHTARQLMKEQLR